MKLQSMGCRKRIVSLLFTLLLLALFRDAPVAMSGHVRSNEITRQSLHSSEPETSAPVTPQEDHPLTLPAGTRHDMSLGTSGGIEKGPNGTMVLARKQRGGSGDDSPEGKTYFTQSNIWYESPEKLYSTNYHVGAILPVGTEVEVIRIRKHSIKFVTPDTGSTYKMTLVRKHSTIALNELFDRYFSEENILAEHGKFYEFTEEERKNIKNGTIALGMSREAVLMAYGYPPSHVTPRLSVSVWTYWTSRFQRLFVTFDDEKVIRIAH